jgi:hypothetical protein
VEGAGVWNNGIPYSDLPAEIVDVSRRGQCGPAALIASSPSGTHVAAEEAREASTEGGVNVRLDLVLQGGWGVGGGASLPPPDGVRGPGRRRGAVPIRAALRR